MLLAMTPEPDWAQIGQTLFEDLTERFIKPELDARTSAATWPDSQVLYRFQVLFPIDGSPEVRLNEEVSGTIMAKAARDLEAGEDVMTTDITGISSYTPEPADAGVPHVTAFAHLGGWSLTFEFASGHPSRHEFFALGQEFAETAREAHAAGRLGVFVDNAFSAVELLAKAELLACRPTVELVLNTRKHEAIARPYHLWAHLGNTEQRFARLLSELAELRGGGRYLDRELELTAARSTEILTTLAAIESHVGDVVDGASSDEAPRSFTAYATRAIRAGELVAAGDFSLQPPKVQASSH